MRSARPDLMNGPIWFTAGGKCLMRASPLEMSAAVGVFADR